MCEKIASGKHPRRPYYFDPFSRTFPKEERAKEGTTGGSSVTWRFAPFRKLNRQRGRKVRSDGKQVGEKDDGETMDGAKPTILFIKSHS